MKVSAKSLEDRIIEADERGNLGVKEAGYGW